MNNTSCENCLHKDICKAHITLIGENLNTIYGLMLQSGYKHKPTSLGVFPRYTDNASTLCEHYLHQKNPLFKEIINAHWEFLYYDEDAKINHYECSHCKAHTKEIAEYGEPNYCKNCGAEIHPYIHPLLHEDCSCTRCFHNMNNTWCDDSHCKKIFGEPDYVTDARLLKEKLNKKNF